VRPDAPEHCGLASDAHDIIDGLAGELCLPLGNEQPRQVVFPGGEIALDGAQLIARDRMLHRQGILQTSYPQPRALQVDVVAAKCDRARPAIASRPRLN